MAVFFIQRFYCISCTHATQLKLQLNTAMLLLQMTELELTQFFSKFGDVKDAKIITDRDGGKSRGYWCT